MTLRFGLENPWISTSPRTPHWNGRTAGRSHFAAALLSVVLIGRTTEKTNEPMSTKPIIAGVGEYPQQQTIRLVASQADADRMSLDENA